MIISKSIITPHFPKVVIVSKPITNDMQAMVDDIDRVEPQITIPRQTYNRMIASMQKRLDSDFLRAIRGF